MIKKEIKQVIVVEGKTDTQKLQKIFGPNLKTIETNGLKINNQLFHVLNQVNQKQGIIVLTDPDGPGKKIREKINQNVDGQILNAFILKKDIPKKSKKIGLAEAESEAIIQALKNLIIFNSKFAKETLTWKDYLENDFYLKKNRQKISQKLGWSEELSSKTMFKWLNWSGIKVEELKKILEN